jgi:hypothetical protein
LQYGYVGRRGGAYVELGFHWMILLCRPRSQDAMKEGEAVLMNTHREK